MLPKRKNLERNVCQFFGLAIRVVERFSDKISPQSPSRSLVPRAASPMFETFPGRAVVASRSISFRVRVDSAHPDDCRPVWVSLVCGEVGRRVDMLRV